MAVISSIAETLRVGGTGHDGRPPQGFSVQSLQRAEVLLCLTPGVKRQRFVGATGHRATFAAGEFGWRENIAGMSWAGLGIWETVRYK